MFCENCVFLSNGMDGLRRYPNDAWEVLLGYDQEKMMGERAGAGLLPDIQAVDKAQRTPADAM